MEEDVKKYNFAKEYRQNMVLDDKERIRAIRENSFQKFVELKNKTEKAKKDNRLSADTIETVEGIIQLCISRYGENLIKLEYASDKKVKEVYRSLTNVNILLDQEIEKVNGSTDKSIESK